jgi:hypothetical protein
MTTEVRTLSISAIARDDRFQVRRKMLPQTVETYRQVYRSGKAMPPVKVALIEGVFVLIDGWHRVAALEQNGEQMVEADVAEMSREEARWQAAKANTEHGQPLTRAERREVFRVYVRTKQHHGKRKGQFKSYRDMGVELGHPHTTVRTWMMKDFPRIAQKIGGNEGMGAGGLPDFPESDHATGATSDALKQLVEAFQGTSDPCERGAIIGMIETALAQMKGSGNWAEREAEDF